MLIKYLLGWDGEQQKKKKKKKVVHVPFCNYSQVFGPPLPFNLLQRTQNKITGLFKITFKADFKVLGF